MTPVIAFRWTGEAMEPLPRFGKECSESFVIGEVYRMTHVEDRSANSHRHFFAAINEAWQNLPESIAEQYPSPEHLRKRALIKAGFYDQNTLVCSSKAEAQKVAAFMRPIDDFSVVLAKRNIVVRYTAKSQSVKSMGKDDFQKSKTAVLDLISELIGTTKKSLETNAAKAQA